MTINIDDFQEDIIDAIKKKVKTLANVSNSQKKIVEEKSFQIFREFIQKEKAGIITISKKISLDTLVEAIIYTAIISNPELPELKISDITKSPNYNVSRYYIRYFRDLYPNKSFNFPPFYGFPRIRNIMAKYIFNIILAKNLDFRSIASKIISKIQKGSYLTNDLGAKDIEILEKLLIMDYDLTMKYLFDLVELVRYLMGSAETHRKIGKISVVIKPIADFLYNQNIRLFQSLKLFNQSTREIYDYLQDNYPDFFPNRDMHSREKLFPSLIGSRIKIFLIKNLYDGKYFKMDMGKCPECIEEGFTLNTDISRLKALQFHHSSKEKQYEYSAKNLYELFYNNRTNINYIEDLINILESRRVVLKCIAHHRLITAKYYPIFIDLISWNNIPFNFPQDIFLLSSEIIHSIVKISIQSHPITRKLTPKLQSSVKLSLITLLKRKYIIEKFYGEMCHICGEFNTKEHLVAFHFHHKFSEKKTIEAHKLFGNESITCNEIVQKLEGEVGGFICSNCHMTLHNDTLLKSFTQIYDDPEIVKIARKDYLDSFEKFRIIRNNGSFGEPLRLPKRLSNNFVMYLIAISDLKESGQIVDNKSLSRWLKVDLKTPKGFFKRNKFIEKFVSIDKRSKSYTYKLTKEGKDAILLILYFRDYYCNLKIK